MRAETLRAFDSLAAHADIGASLCEHVAAGGLSVPTSLSALATQLGLPQARLARLKAALLRGEQAGLFRRASELSWAAADPAECSNVAPLLRGASLYVSRVHRDRDTVDVVLTKPPAPSQMAESLDQMLKGSWGIKDTRELLPLMAESARERFTVMTPYLDEVGAAVVLNLFERANVPHRLLVLRYGKDGRPPAALTTVRPRLNELAVHVLSFRLERPDAAGNETFHAKVVLADRASAYVGSLNMHRWSFEYSLELGLHVRGDAAARIADVLTAIEAVAEKISV